MNRSEKDPKRIIKAAMTEEKYNAHSVRPCKGGGILVEGTFDKPFSMEVLCRILRDTGKCAEKLGVARSSTEDVASRYTEMAGLTSTASNLLKKP